MAPPQTGDQFFQRIPGLKGEDDCRDLYDDWAESYDHDLTHPSQEYTGPREVARAVVDAHGKIGGEILDAGCGTGLSGMELKKVGATTIDGIDLSPGMLERAEKTGVYRNLATADLSKAIDKPDSTYDVVTCVGTLTQGHVGPVPALSEFVRVAKPGGIVAATIREDVWESGGYKVEVERLGQSKLVEVVSTASALYRAGGKARILVLKKK